MTSPNEQVLVGDSTIDRFDVDYISDATLDRLIENVIVKNSGISDIADVGGGNGRLLDRVLARFPSAHGTNFEISARLRSLNATLPRKTVVADSLLSIDASAAYDLIFMNWVLHHLVGRSVGNTKQLIGRAIDVAYRALRPQGFLVVSENILESWLPDGISSAALFTITRSRFLKPLISRMRDGSAVAGVGVYYLSMSNLQNLLALFKSVHCICVAEHDYGWKLRLIGITRVTENIFIFQK